MTPTFVKKGQRFDIGWAEFEFHRAFAMAARIDFDMLEVQHKLRESLLAAPETADITVAGFIVKMVDYLQENGFAFYTPPDKLFILRLHENDEIIGHDMEESIFFPPGSFGYDPYDEVDQMPKVCQYIKIEQIIVENKEGSENDLCQGGERPEV